jgi:hypothetical protein
LAVDVREVPLTYAERRDWTALQRQIDDAIGATVERYRAAHGLDPRTVLDPARRVLVAPVTSSP